MDYLQVRLTAANLTKVSIITDYEGIFPSKLQDHWSQRLRCCLHHLLPDVCGPHEDELVDT